jgi:hypothetical protein
VVDFIEMARSMPVLQSEAWPPVADFRGLPADFVDFLALGAQPQASYLARRREHREEHGELIHRYLDVVSAYIFGYRDSPCYGKLDDDFEARLLRAKLVIERELFEHWLQSAPVPLLETQGQAADYLWELAGNNASLGHELFDYVEEHAPSSALRTFLRTEMLRNEVVDDEVALCSAGIQGPMKLALVSNLWDECGRGRLEHFHTYWLRELLHSLDDWVGVRSYRSEQRPWFAQITTNVFNVFLTRPGVRLCAYGWFATNESWVAPHFRKIVAGLRRTGVYSHGAALYFEAHINIDPNHTRELLDALRVQRPQLTPDEVARVLRGAHAAVAATTAQYDRMLAYLKSIATDPKPTEDRCKL